MVEFEVTNTSNIRKYSYGTQFEPGETKKVDILVKEAEEIPSSSFHVERLEEPESSQADRTSTEEVDEDQNQEEDSGGETE